MATRLTPNSRKIIRRCKGIHIIISLVTALGLAHSALADSSLGIVNQAIDTARSLVDSENPYDQILGAGILSDIGDASALAILETHAMGDDIVFQRSAIDTLIGVQHPAGIDLIYRLASQSETFTQFLAQSLATNPRDDMGDFLLGVLQESKAEVQRYAIQALTHMKITPNALGVINKVIDSPESGQTTKAYGLYYLAQRGLGSEVEQRLLDLITTGDLVDREVVAVALAHLNTPSALEGLMKLEKSTDARVALAALSSHAALGDTQSIKELTKIIKTGTSLNAEVGASALRRLQPEVAHAISVDLFNSNLRDDPGGRLLESWGGIDWDATEVYAWGLAQKNPDITLQTIWLVGQRQEREMLDTLGKYLNDKNPAIRGMAAWAIVHIAPEEYVPGTKV
jgi:HEAT repeat protein